MISRVGGQTQSAVTDEQGRGLTDKIFFNHFGRCLAENVGPGPEARGRGSGLGYCRRRPRETGFTFLELLTVLALMALLLGLVAPTFYRSWERERLHASLRQFAAVLRLAR
ncbi:MAG: prepilin-type N-terminal cleavage/methylation domain-containing protein, partial [Deltaproteobacteria bacterium]|nr:prepilin-type N-terminal cleavage/methylation domain-containing protein [Deltaproteobacteria bacterium]